MWPFTRNAKCNSEPEETDWSRQRRISDAAIQALRDWREVGETFEYAGRTLVVAKHWMVGPFGITRIPCIVARYGDSQGVLRTITLDSDECIALMQHEQPNA